MLQTLPLNLKKIHLKEESEEKRVSVKEEKEEKEAIPSYQQLNEMLAAMTAQEQMRDKDERKEQFSDWKIQKKRYLNTILKKTGFF